VECHRIYAVPPSRTSTSFDSVMHDAKAFPKDTLKRVELTPLVPRAAVPEAKMDAIDQ
jgi:hypothetical protein